MHRAKILIIQTGHARDPILDECGDFDEFFLRAIRRHHPESKVDVDVFPIIDLDENPPAATNYQGIITTGSASMLDENLGWMQKSLDYTNRCLDKRIPLLAVCFGHQLLGAACGAQVGPNPNGRANGTVELTMSSRMPTSPPPDRSVHSTGPSSPAGWMRGGNSTPVQVSHRDVILDKSPHFKVLGTAAHDPNHFIGAGDCAWGVQFHPEWTKKISEMYIDLRQEILQKELGKQRFDKMRSTVRETPEATELIPQFITYCRER